MPPLTYDASGLSKNTTSPATSSGSPKRCIGMRASSRSCAPSPSAVSNCRTIGVSIGAGHTALTRMPRRASSTAAVRVRPTTACLRAEYGPSVRDAGSPATYVCFNVSATRSTSTRLAPSDARRAATARPMPPPAPVMTATLPVKRPISERGDDRDLDEELLLRQLRLDGGARRCVDGIDPGVPRRVHLIVRLHLGEVHGGRQQIRLVGADGGQERVDLLQDGLGLRLCRRLVAGHLTGEVDGVAVDDGLAHAGSDLVALDAHDEGPFRVGWFGCPQP